MKTIIPHIAAALIVIGLAIYFPNETISPGGLLNGHEELKQDCLDCHSPFRGASVDKCIACHRPKEIGRLTVAGIPVSLQPGKILFHQHLARQDCMGCHSEHNGAEADSLFRQFSHNFLQTDVKTNCVSCHSQRRPADHLHQQAGDNCASCHSPGGWKPASFDHNRLSESAQKQCASCHQQNRPDDALHRQVQQNCSACHKTTAWRPATYEHDKYFRFDRHHPSDCLTCHTNLQNFSEYTCYGCHEHSRAKISEEHREEGILQFEDCARCHRSGDEDEAKRIWRNQRRGKERQDDRRREREHHEDDD